MPHSFSRELYFKFHLWRGPSLIPDQWPGAVRGVSVLICLQKWSSVEMSPLEIWPEPQLMSQVAFRYLCSEGSPTDGYMKCGYWPVGYFWAQGFWPVGPLLPCGCCPCAWRGGTCEAEFVIQNTVASVLLWGWWWWCHCLLCKDRFDCQSDTDQVLYTEHRLRKQHVPWQASLGLLQMHVVLLSMVAMFYGRSQKVFQFSNICLYNCSCLLWRLAANALLLASCCQCTASVWSQLTGQSWAFSVVLRWAGRPGELWVD